MKLDFYEDPGHGWLAVPLELLDSLQLLDKVSSYSYIRGRFAHLEEDCDYSLFANIGAMAGPGSGPIPAITHQPQKEILRTCAPWCYNSLTGAAAPVSTQKG
jgi:hypothetical protein